MTPLVSCTCIMEMNQAPLHQSTAQICGTFTSTDRIDMSMWDIAAVTAVTDSCIHTPAVNAYILTMTAIIRKPGIR